MNKADAGGDDVSKLNLTFICFITIFTTKLFSLEEIMERKHVTLYDGIQWKDYHTFVPRYRHSAQFKPVRGIHQRRSFAVQAQNTEDLLKNITAAFKDTILLLDDQNIDHINNINDEVELNKIHPQDVGTLQVWMHHDKAEKILIDYTDDHVENIMGRVDEWIDEMLHRAFSTRK